MRIKVKSMFNGEIAIAEKYIQKAKERREPLEIWFKDEVMFADPKEAKFSKETFRDRWGRENYRLAYFRWKPQTQKRLI